MPTTPETQEVERGSQEFKIILSSVVSSRSTWPTWTLFQITTTKIHFYIISGLEKSYYGRDALCIFHPDSVIGNPLFFIHFMLPSLPYSLHVFSLDHLQVADMTSLWFYFAKKIK